MDSRYLYGGIVVLLFAFIIFTYVCFKLCLCQQAKDGENEEAEEPFLKKPRTTELDIERPYHSNRRQPEQRTPIPYTEPECIQDEANHMPNLDHDKQNTSTLIYDQKAPFLPKEPLTAKQNNCKLQLVLSFNREEKMLTLTLDKISDISTKRYHRVRMAITLLPEKTQQGNTGVELIGDNGLVNLEHYTFKFHSLKPEHLVTSALRFRLYGKLNDVLEVSLGQLFVHIYELSTHPGKLIVCKEFTQQQNVNLKYLECLRANEGAKDERRCPRGKMW